jgi:CDP-paratose 2-epimerase
VRVFVTGICGFVGSTLAIALKEADPTLEILGCDSFIRPGSETNRLRLASLGIKVRHADLRVASDLDTLPRADWMIDAAALPSVLAGVDGKSSSRQVVEHNLLGTINLLEYCRAHRAGFILLSTSRVYSIPPLASLAMVQSGDAYHPDPNADMPPGMTPEGVSESFSTAPPVSLYGSTKVASETLAQEYGATYEFPVHINRCGVMAGPGQFGHAEQGIFSYWIHAWRQRRPLRFIGFEGSGFQVRDCLHPRDLVPLLLAQMSKTAGTILNVSGGLANSMSLAQLSAWCTERFHPHSVAKEPAGRPFDVPWLVLDSSRVKQLYDWEPLTRLASVLEEIAAHAEAEPNWLNLGASS